MGVLNKLISKNKYVTPDEIALLITATNTSLVGDVLNIVKERGENNTTPSLPSTSGVMSRFDASSYWTSRLGLTFPRSGPSGFALTSDTSIVCGGVNSSSFPYSSTEKYTNTSNTWATKSATLNTARGYFGTATLTSDTAMCFGGNNGDNAVVYANFEKYSDSINTWVNKSFSGSFTARLGVIGSSLTSDLILCSGGYNGSFLGNTDRYSNSSISITNMTVNPSPTFGMQSASITSDLSLFSGGTNSGGYSSANRRFSNNLNSWVSRTNLWTGITFPSATSMTSDLFMSCGGINGPYMFDGRRYSDSANIWISKPGFPTAGRGYLTSSSLTSSVGLYYCGVNGASTTNIVDRYTDNEVSLRSGLAFISNYLNNTPAVPNSDDSSHIYTNSLMISNPNSIYVTTLEDKFASDIPDTTYDVSPDGGTAWSLLEQPINTTINLINLTVTDLRLRFNLKRSLNGTNIWLARNSFVNAKHWQTGNTLTSNLALSSCGTNNNGGTSNLGDTDLFNESTNQWTSLTANPTPRNQLASGSLTSDFGVFFGGYNGGLLVYGNNDKFSYSANSWLSRAAVGIRDEHASNGMTSDLVITFGGFNTVIMSNVDRYQDSINSWTSRTTLTFGRYVPASSALTSDLSLIAAGYNASVAIATTQRYSDSNLSWTTRTDTATGAIFAHAMSGLTSDSTLKSGGSITLQIQSERYNDSGNIWTMKNSTLVPRYGLSSTNMTSNSVFCFGGRSVSAILASAEKYIDGETYFKGFGLR